MSDRREPHTADRSERTSPRTAGEMLALARSFLARKELENARREAEHLVAHALGLDRLHLFLALDRPVAEAEVERARASLMRRAKREPSAYITGAREFYGRRFAVDRDVLIPRPETELLVDLLRERLGRAGKASEEAPLDGRASAVAPRLADVGTGSGCLAVTLALELAGARVCACDLSAGALRVARANAAALGAQVLFVQGDGPEALAPHGPFDWLVSNPPYVRPEEWAQLEPEVRDFEPRAALCTPQGEPEHWLRRLCGAGFEALAPGGGLLIELGGDQAEAALAQARRVDPAARVHADLAGLPRVLEVRRRGS